MSRLPLSPWRGAWVLARRVHDGIDGAGNELWHWEYWRGDRGGGKPRHSLWLQDAYHFATAASALECAETHRDLRGSEEWRVIAARPRELSNKTPADVATAFRGAVVVRSNGGRQ